MNEKIIGQSCRLLIDGEWKNARVKDLLSDKGVLSNVYSLEFINSSADCAWVLKVPKKEPDPSFLRESDVFLKVKDSRSIPVTVAIEFDFIDIEDALVMEYLDSDWLFHPRYIQKKISNQELAYVLNEALALVEQTSSMNMFNYDLKWDNFYWLPDQKRFVWRDWNATREINDRLASETGKQIRAVLQIFYETINAPEKMPDVSSLTLNSTIPNHWHSTWRAIRRTLIELDEVPTTPISRIRSRFDWQYTFIGLFNSDPVKAKEAINSHYQQLETNQTEAGIPFYEVREQIFDACEYILNKTEENEWKLFFESITEKIRTLEFSESPAVRIIAALKSNFKLGQISGQVSIALSEIELAEMQSQREKWRVVPWMLLAQLFDNLQKFRGLKTEDIRRIIPYFEKAEENYFKIQPDISTPIPFSDEVHQLINQILTAETLTNEINQHHDASSSELLRLSDDRNKFIINTITQAKWPNQVVEIFKKRTYINIDREQLVIEEQKEKALKMQQKQLDTIKQKIIEILENSSTYPAFEIDQFIQQYHTGKKNKELLQEYEVEYFESIHLLLKSNEWLSLSPFFVEQPDSEANSGSLIRNISSRIITYFQQWQADSLKKPIYQKDIIYLNQIMNTKAMENFINQDLAAKVELAQKALSTGVNTEVLTECKANGIQPWMTLDGKGVSIDSLLLLQKANSDVLAAEKEIINLSDLDNRMQLVRESLDEQQTKLNSLKGSLSESLLTIEEKRNELENEFRVHREQFEHLEGEKNKYQEILDVLQSEYDDLNLSDWKLVDLYLTAILNLVQKSKFEGAYQLAVEFKEKQNQNQSKYFDLWYEDLKTVQEHPELTEHFKSLNEAFHNQDSEQFIAIHSKLLPHGFHVLLPYFKGKYNQRRKLEVERLDQELIKNMQQWEKLLLIGDFERAKGQCLQYKQTHQKGYPKELVKKLDEWLIHCKKLEAAYLVVKGYHEALRHKDRDKTILYGQVSYILDMIIEDEDKKVLMSINTNVSSI